MIAALFGLTLGLMLCAHGAQAQDRYRAQQQRAAALLSWDREQAQMQERMLKETQAREALRRAKRGNRGDCQFKPVMSDDEMAKCRAAAR